MVPVIGAARSDGAKTLVANKIDNAATTKRFMPLRATVVPMMLSRERRLRR